MNLRPSGYEPDELPLLHPAASINLDIDYKIHAKPEGRSASDLSALELLYREINDLVYMDQVLDRLVPLSSIPYGTYTCGLSNR